MVRGKAGSGKSTATKRACKLAEERARANKVITAFFFNSRGVSMETRLEGSFRSTLHLVVTSGAPWCISFTSVFRVCWKHGYHVGLWYMRGVKH